MTRPVFARGLGTGPAGPPGPGSDITSAEIEASRDAAEAARDAAVAARAGAEAVGTTNDTIIASRINDPGSATATALSASIADGLETVRTDFLATSTVGAIVACAPAAAPLAIDTYDGGDQITHPSVYFNPNGWNGHRYWMAATPYAVGADSSIENPSLYVSEDGRTWIPAPGVAAPVEPEPDFGFNSDTHLTQGPDGRLYLFWRTQAGPDCILYYRASADGIDWSDRHVVLTVATSSHDYASPAFVYDNGLWRMWAIDITPSPNVLVTLTASDLTGPWSAPVTCTGLVSGAGREPWHIDVHRIGSEFVALYVDTSLNSSGGGTLYRAVSTDGVGFVQDPAPFLTPAGGTWAQILYRSCLLPARVSGRDGYEVWYTSANPTYRIGHTFASLLEARAKQDDPAAMFAASSAINDYTVGDIVNRPDSTSTAGTASSGQAWTVDAGTGGVQGKALYAPAGTNTRLVIDSGLADVDFGATFKAVGGEQFLVARHADGDNFIRAGSTGTAWVINTIVAGALATIGILEAAYLPITAGRRVRLTCKGSLVSLYVDGFLVAQGTSSALLSNTKVGWQTPVSTTRYSNFYAKPA